MSPPKDTNDSNERIKQAHKSLVEAMEWKRRNHRYKSFGDTWLAALITLGTLSLVIVFVISLNPYPIFALAAALLFIIIGVACGQQLSRLWWKRAENVQRECDEARRVLTASYNVRAVGPLLEAFDRETVTADVPAALVRLLPLLTQEDAFLLTPGQKRRLYRLVQKPYTYNLALELAAVGALEFVGDASAPAVLSRLLRSRETPPLLAQAAQHCLESLNERGAQESQTQTLLRASAVPGASADQLLRAASAAAQTPPEQMLRAASE